MIKSKLWSKAHMFHVKRMGFFYGLKKVIRLLFDGFNLNIQRHQFAHAHRHVFINTPVSTIDGRQKVTTTNLSFVHGALIAVKFSGSQRDGMGLSIQR